MLSRMLSSGCRIARAHCGAARVWRCAAAHPAAAWRPLAPNAQQAAGQETVAPVPWVSSVNRSGSTSSNTSSSRRSVASRASGDGAATEADAAPAHPPKQYNVRQITKDDVDFSFARSSGPGGQNVNKVNTKVDMRFQLEEAAWIPEEVKEAIRRAEKNKFTKDGWLVVTSTKHRTQSANMDDALAKLQEIIDKAVEAVTPKEADPETVARVKKAIKAGNERRLDGKKKDAKKKAERRRRDFD